jgi:hypothetical protein
MSMEISGTYSYAYPMTVTKETGRPPVSEHDSRPTGTKRVESHIFLRYRSSSRIARVSGKSIRSSASSMHTEH